MLTGQVRSVRLRPAAHKQVCSEHMHVSWLHGGSCRFGQEPMASLQQVVDAYTASVQSGIALPPKPLYLEKGKPMQASRCFSPCLLPPSALLSYIQEGIHAASRN